MVVDHKLAIADVQVIALETPDRTGSRGMHRGECEDQAVRRLGNRGHGVVDVLGLQRLEDAVLVLADADAAGRVLENGAALLRPAKQRPQDDERVPSLAALESIELGENVVAGHLAQVIEAARPLQQDGADPVEVVPDRVLVAGLRPGATVVQEAGAPPREARGAGNLPSKSPLVAGRGRR